MKRFATFTSIALSILASSITNVSAVETLGITETFRKSNSTLLAAKANTTSQFVTVDGNHNTVGTLKLIEENGQQYLEFGDDFQTVSGPAVEVILHKNDTVPVNIAESDYLTLAPIQSTQGTQRYAVPDGVDLNDYGSVAVWCREFNVTFGYAQL